MSERRSFWSELRNRYVMRAAVAHLVFFWLLAQIAETILPYIGVVDEPVRWAVVAAVALFPVTLIISWFFDHPWHRFTGSRLVLDIVIIGIISVTAVSWVVRNIPQAALTRTSIVILPFTHSPDDPLEKSVSRILAIEINSLLMKSKSIDVIGFESASSTVLSGLSLQAIAERLGVEYVLAGTIALSSDSMKLTINLQDRGGNRLWDRQIQENVDKLFAVQESIAAEITSRLGAGDDQISIASVAAERCPMPTDPTALTKYFTARHYVGMRTQTAQSNLQLADAINNYELLIDQYPDFAEAYSGLAWALYHQAYYDESTDREANLGRSKEMAAKSLQLCGTLGEARHLLPKESDHENYWIAHYQNLLASIEMEPDKTENYQLLVRLYADTGLIRRSMELAERDYRLNPLAVRSIKQLAGAYSHQGRLEEADELFKLSIELGSTSPNFALDAIEIRACNGDLKCVADWWLNYQEFADEEELARYIMVLSAPMNTADVIQKNADFVQLLRENPYAVNHFTFFSCQADVLTASFFEFSDIAEAADAYWYWPNVWMPICSNIWSAPEFPEFAESAGLVEFWHEVGWPEMCWPTDNGFDCGVKPEVL